MIWWKIERCDQNAVVNVCSGVSCVQLPSGYLLPVSDNDGVPNRSRARNLHTRVNFQPWVAELKVKDCDYVFRVAHECRQSVIGGKVQDRPMLSHIQNRMTGEERVLCV